MNGKQIKKNEGTRIVLGYPLDMLFDRKCVLFDYLNSIRYYNKLIKCPKKGVNEWKGEKGGIILPSDYNPGTGNIVIRGKPGTAKSTFALQLAVAATVNDSDSGIYNNCNSLYISLEESPENVMTKASSFGWENQCMIVNHLEDLTELSSIKSYAEELKFILQQPKGCKILNPDYKVCNEFCVNHKRCELAIKPHVILPMLTPGNFFSNEQKDDGLFLERYKQIENILASGRYAREKEKEENKKGKNKVIMPDLAFVIIDSLNVFGDKPLTREELNRLFLLFKHYKVIGIFIVEDDDYIISGSLNRPLNEITDYLADVVISLTADEDDGYFLRYFEIKKSRYQHQVYGKHPYRLNQVT
jgi:KaiC/GvpD/RAD55 family RecA-like ATPase